MRLIHDRHYRDNNSIDICTSISEKIVTLKSAVHARESMEIGRERNAYREGIPVPEVGITR